MRFKQNESQTCSLLVTKSKSKSIVFLISLKLSANIIDKIIGQQSMEPKDYVSLFKTHLIFITIVIHLFMIRILCYNGKLMPLKLVEYFQFMDSKYFKSRTERWYSGCSSRVSELHSHDTHGGSQLSVISIPRDLISSWPPETLGRIDIHVSQH